MRNCGTCPIRGTEYCHLVNPKAPKYTAFEKRAIREELDRKEKTDKLLSTLKCLVMRDLIKDCPEKKSVIEIVKEYK